MSRTLTSWPTVADVLMGIVHRYERWGAAPAVAWGVPRLIALDPPPGVVRALDPIGAAAPAGRLPGRWDPHGTALWRPVAEPWARVPNSPRLLSAVRGLRHLLGGEHRGPMPPVSAGTSALYAHPDGFDLDPDKISPLMSWWVVGAQQVSAAWLQLEAGPPDGFALRALRTAIYLKGFQSADRCPHMLEVVQLLNVCRGLPWSAGVPVYRSGRPDRLEWLPERGRHAPTAWVTQYGRLIEDWSPEARLMMTELLSLQGEDDAIGWAYRAPLECEQLAAEVEYAT